MKFFFFFFFLCCKSVLANEVPLASFTNNDPSESVVIPKDANSKDKRVVILQNERANIQKQLLEAKKLQLDSIDKTALQPAIDGLNRDMELIKDEIGKANNQPQTFLKPIVGSKLSSKPAVNNHESDKAVKAEVDTANESIKKHHSWDIFNEFDYEDGKK